MSTKDETKHELLKQLHEQYAINNNNNLSVIISFIAALIVVIGFFAYVYVSSISVFAPHDRPLFYNEVFYADALLLAYIASTLVLAILVYICYYQGAAQRKEQFIVYAIRRLYLGENHLVEGVKEEDNGKYNKIFPEDYHPYKEGFLKIVQGLYGEFIKIFILVFIVITVAVLFKFLPILTLGGITIIITCLLILLCFVFCIKVYCSYYKTKEEYITLYSKAMNENEKECCIKIIIKNIFNQNKNK